MYVVAEFYNKHKTEEATGVVFGEDLSVLHDFQVNQNVKSPVYFGVKAGITTNIPLHYYFFGDSLHQHDRDYFPLVKASRAIKFGYSKFDGRRPVSKRHKRVTLVTEEECQELGACLIDVNTRWQFSTNLNRERAIGHNAVFTAINFAYYMGLTKIYTIGVGNIDCGNWSKFESVIPTDLVIEPYPISNIEPEASVYDDSIPAAKKFYSPSSDIEIVRYNDL